MSKKICPICDRLRDGDLFRDGKCSVCHKAINNPSGKIVTEYSGKERLAINDKEFSIEKE